MARSIPCISMYDHVNTSLNPLKSLVYAINPLGKHEALMMLFSITIGLVDMFIFIVGVISEIFPSLKALEVGMRLQNQSTFPRGIKSLVSMVY